jgi:replicative DNA helicase
MNTAEEAFYAHLTDPDSLDIIVREGFASDLSREVIPTELGRKLTAWAIDYYFENGRLQAPSKDAITHTWGSEMAALELEIRDDVETDSVQWAIKQMRSDFVDYSVGEFAKELAASVRKADPDKRVEALQDGSQLLHLLAQAVRSQRNELSAADGIADALKRYNIRLDKDHKYDGMTFGIPELDDHILGLHPGEIAIFAATSGGGKSWWSLITLLSEWQRKRRVMLYTLENSVEMTYDRLACVYCRVPYDKWQRSECDEGEISRVREFAQLLKEDDLFVVSQPSKGEATGTSMIRRATVEDCQSVIIDQVSHIEPVAGSKARQRNEIVAEIVRDLGVQIKEANIPLLLLHQINRKGREEARKNGHYLMEHMGEATQVENDATLILAPYQSPDHVLAEWAELQMLKFRRGKIKEFEIEWRPHVGDVRVRRELERD